MGKQLSSQYHSDHLRALQYFRRVIIFRKDVFFCKKTSWSRTQIFYCTGTKMLCISVFMFFESVQANFYPGHFWSTGRQIHNSQRYVFYVFMYLCLPIWTGLRRIKIPAYSSLSLLIRSLRNISSFFWCIIPHHVES